MRKAIVIAGVLTVSLVVLASFAQAAATAPSWSTSCWWKYRIRMHNGDAMDALGDIWYNVTKTTAVDVNGTSYNCFEVSLKGSGKGNVTFPPMPKTACTFTMGGFHMIEENTYKTVKINESMTISIYVPVMTRYDETSNDGPEDTFNFNLDEGETWYSNSTVYSESVMSTIMGITHTNNVTLSNNKYTCLKHGTFNVNAGSFDGYLVNQTSLRGPGGSEYVYSPTVGNVIMQNMTLPFNSTSVTVISLVLLDYNYAVAPEFGYYAPVAGIALLTGTALLLRLGPCRKK